MKVNYKMYIKNEIVGQVITNVRQATDQEKLTLVGDVDQQLTVIELLDGRVITAVHENRPATLVTVDANGDEGMVFSNE